MKLSQQVIAEFVGTLALVFIGAGSVVILSLYMAGNTGILGIALAHGLVLAVMVTSLGHISGGHFNPAVTVGVWVTGKIESVRAAVYIVAQLAGATAGAGLLRLAIPESIWSKTSLGVPTVNHPNGITNGRGVLIEAILTFFLVFTVFATAIDERGAWKAIAGFAIGLVLTFDILMGGPFTGAAMNPARWFGPALVAGKWADSWVYIAGPLTGAIIAAALYWFSFLRPVETAIAVPAEALVETSEVREETGAGGG